MADTLTFANPLLLWLLVPVLLVALWSVLHHLATRRLLEKLVTVPMVARVAASWSPVRGQVRIVLWTLAGVLLVLAAARPRYGLRETEVSNAGIDIAIVVDASKSMLAKDVVPNRLQGTTLEVSALLDKLAGGRVALIPFAGIPFVQCPLTADHDVIRMYMTDLKPEDLPVGGTNIGRAIGLAVETLTGEREKAEAETRDNLIPQFRGSKNKAIVLFSDGEDHEGAAIEAAQKAAEQGVRIFTVGVGTASGNPVPILGPDGSSVGSQKDEAGNLVFSALNMDLLEKIATATGGKAFHYDRQSVVLPLFQSLDALEKAEYQAQFQSLGEDRFQYLLGPALLLLLAEWLLGNRKREKKVKVPKKTLVATALLLLIPLQALAIPRWLQHENPDVREGRELLEQKKAGEAVKAFQTAQATRPEHTLLWYGLGLAQATLGARQDAVTSLSRALGAMKDRDAGLEADIHYALGTTQLEWGYALEKTAQNSQNNQNNQQKKDDKKDEKPPEEKPASTEDPLPHFREAVKSLEAALLADPERTESKRNLELARLAAFPPCRSRDKANEPNDQPGVASPLAFAPDQREQTLDLRACPEDRDFFRVDLQPGDRFSASLKLKKETNPALEPDDPLGTPAKLGVWLENVDGQKILRGAEPNQPPLDAVDLGKVDQPGPVLVDVRNVAEVETAYDLTVKLLPACSRIEDRYEPNDSPEIAKVLTLGEPVKGRLCPLNDDDFAVDLQPGQGLLVKTKTKVDIGADSVELSILGPDHRALALGKKSGEGQAVRMARALIAGRYVVQLRGGLDTEADYEMQVEVLPACQLRDDAYEDNDQALQANPLDPETLKAPLDNLQLCPGDDDWFAVELKAGESLFADLGADLKELPDAADLAGALTVEVYDEKGQLWAQAIGGPGGETLSRTAVVLAPPPGTYRIRVTGGGVDKPHFPLPPLPPGSVQVTPQNPQPQAVNPPGPQMPQPPGIQAVPMPPPGGTMGAPPGGNTVAPPGQPPQGQPPPPIAHVMLPPNLAPPLVNLREAKLDMGYTLKLRILPPCPAGNDEFEPNDTAATAKKLEMGGEQLMRICKGDEDWLSIEQKAGQNLQIMARYDLSLGPVELEAFDESGKTSIAKGERHGAEGKKTLAAVDDSPAARKGRTAITGVALKGEKKDRVVKLRANAAKDVENFYVLQIQEPPPPSDKQQDQQKKDDEQSEDDKEKEKQEKEKQDAEKQKEPPPDQKQLQQQMERADHNPTNLEAQEALKKSPFKNQTPTKDW